MKRTLLAGLSLTFFLLAPATTPAQDRALENKVIESVRVYAPAWQLVSSEGKPYHEEMKFEALFFRWADGEAYGEAIIFLHRSAPDASLTLKSLVEQDYSLQLKKKILKKAKERFGDESYAWEGRGPDAGRFGYIFRRGGAIVFTGSSSRQAAGQLASLTLRAILED